MSKGIVLSLYDFTGEACRPWAEAGYECYAYDIQHDPDFMGPRNSGTISYIHADLHDQETLNAIRDEFSDQPVIFGMAFPVCTDMAVSGAAWFKKKAAADPEFQTKAVNYAVGCSVFFNDLDVPFFIENPVSVLATKWRKPDYSFHPYEYGGYIPYSEPDHPRWPEYIAPFDAYKKKTCLWTGGGFVMPTKVAVDCEGYHGNGYSTAMMKLGGKSQRTKDIRSATPRGFATAVYQSNKEQT
jgi:hypothetical protein